MIAQSTMYSLLQKTPDLLATLSTCEPGKAADKGYQIYVFTNSWYNSMPPAVRYILSPAIL
jgi:hypothetical protein